MLCKEPHVVWGKEMKSGSSSLSTNLRHLQWWTVTGSRILRVVSPSWCTHAYYRQRCSHKVLSFKNSKTIKIRNWNGILTWCEYFNAKKNAHFWILIFNSESCLNLRESDYTVGMIPLIIISGTGRYDHTPVLFFRLAGLVQMIWAAGFWPDEPSVAAASDCW